MPIGTADAYNVYRNRYEEIIRPAVEGVRVNDEQAFKCVRADFVSQTGSITRDVLARLYRADAVVADLTDLNPNVFYELGVRHSLRSGTLLVGVKGTKPPFDVGDLRVIFYEDRVGGEKLAIPQIQEALFSLLDEVPQIDSPVLYAIPELTTRQPVAEVRARVASLEQENHLLRVQLEVSEKSNLFNQGALEALRQAVEGLTSRLPEQERRDTEERIEEVSRTRGAAVTAAPARSIPGIALDPASVFVLMPFRPEFEPVYQVIVEAATHAGLRAFRADSIMSPGNILNQIFEAIGKAGFIVADLSGRNQNVMYELGVANTMGKETLLMSDSLDDVPFDIRHFRVLVYERTFGGVSKLREQLDRVFLEYVKRRSE